ncbi:DUF421 domain-containing protein [Halalkalibacter hemicellulosilyticus]|uniref:YetF C-terminal domain-containing protein n=1 Tax=Halalkalibacter hemicellulosilyticusJCM 9152 TaxID=1236971 RepID=W4QC67_9BACI|nr:DUF421 domain-containing protein [Halalkalibacter hemicellulosilyticus]GAE28954.1 hypothetical protein JCM9152_292 [Halalkalibacter hemicellulosilyticusJCM 9152]
MEELFQIFGRIMTILPLLLLMTLYMGRRSIGQMPVFDFLIMMTLASVTGADIADPSIQHTYTAFAIVVIALFQKVVSTLLIKRRPFAKWITFHPIEVIRDGKLIKANLQNVQYSIDNILQLLRQKDIFNIEDVYSAIIEANGSLSVQKKANKVTPTREEFNLPNQIDTIAYPVIVEGRFMKEVITHLNTTEESLRQQLIDKGIHRIEDIFLCTMTRSGDTQLSYTTKQHLNPYV